MTNLYLVAHRVRGKPAFDIACHMTCPLCSTHDVVTNTWVDPEGCYECDDLGYWWIIPTSGHRAYPWWFGELNHIMENHLAMTMDEISALMPPDLPDHYPHDTRLRSQPSLADRLGITKRPPLAPIVRRI